MAEILATCGGGSSLRKGKIMSIAKNSQDANQDIVWGAEAIAAVIRVNQRRAFHLLENGALLAKKVGGRWVASRKKLLAALID